MVMGDRIKPGSARAVGQVKKSPDETAGDHSPEVDTRTGSGQVRGRPQAGE